MPPHPCQSLAQLAIVLCHTVADVAVDVLVGVSFGPPQPPEGAGELQVAVQPTPPGVRLFDAVAGFIAPQEWDAFGVAGLGRASLMEAREAGYEERIVAHLVGRDGAAVSAIGPAAGPFELTSDAAGGFLADACRRALGLPSTAPDPPSPLGFWADAWLTALQRARPGALRSWEQVTAAFPGGLSSRTAPSPLHLVEEGRRLALAHPWPELRTACADGRLVVDDLTPEVAAWMDDAMFACWAGEGAVPLATLAEDVVERLPPALGRRVSWVLRSWGVLPTEAQAVGRR